MLNVQLRWKQGGDVTPGLVDKGSFKVDEVAHSEAPDVVTIRARSVDFTSDLKTRRKELARHAARRGRDARRPRAAGVDDPSARRRQPQFQSP